MMKSPILLAAMLAVVAPSAHAALTLEQGENAFDRSFERLPDLRLVRGSKMKTINLVVTATAGETWTLAGDEAWLQLSTTSGTGDGTVQLRVDVDAFAALDNTSATLALVEDGTAQAVTLDVNIDIWPKLLDTDDRALLRAHVRDRATWPKDGGWANRWALWGFLPDDVSHPGENAGVNMDTWEKTACADGVNDDTCVGEHQAGMAAGMAADQGHLLSTGDDRVIVAVLDSGIKWGERDLITKHYLNAEELRACPPPGADADAVDARREFDVNQDGVFNIRDYDTADWAVDLNRNGVRDPQDLIWGNDGDGPCSDGIDVDANGYVDDISGWDFFWNDNDASDDTSYGHGTGEAKDSVGEAHNISGDAGVCPRCQVLNVRVGDSFVADVNQFADGVVFAVDSGAKVVQEALGTINNTPYAQNAINYAYENGTAIVASAADEASYHHNMPGSLERTLYVHAIVADTDGAHRDAATFLNFGNCTNWGGKLMLSTPGTGCSSEATGNTSGHAALVYGYYEELRDQHLAANDNVDYWTPNLGAEELYQVLTQSADDIDVPGMELDDAAFEAKRFKSNEGWDLQFGYGRNNVRRSMELLRDMLIPAEGRIDSPLWYEVFDPSRTPSVDIAISLKSSRLENLAWKLYVAEGVEGRAPVEIATGSGNASEEVVAQLDLSATGPLADLVARAAAPASGDPEEFSITLFLETTGVNPAGVEVKGGFRKVVAIREDPAVADGFPLRLGASGEGSPTFTDINGDGQDELVLATADGLLHVFNADGTQLAGFPVTTNVYPALNAEVCASTPAKCHLASAAFATGAIDPTTIYSTIESTVAIGDLDGDGGTCRDLVAGTMDGALYAWDCEGNVLDGFPVAADPAYTAEFVGALRCEREGAEVIGCNLPQRFAEYGFFSSPVLVDLDQDGDLEIVQAGLDQHLYVWNHDGSEVNGFPVHLQNTVFPAYDIENNIFRHDGRIVATPTVANLFGDGVPMIVLGTNERVENSTQAFVYAIYPDGNAHAGGPFPPNWPTTVSGFIPDEVLPFLGRGNPNSPVSADIDDDGKDEIIVAGLGGVQVVLNEEGTEDYFMEQTQASYGIDHNVDDPALGSLPVINSPSLGDLDLDGRVDIINGTAGLGLIQIASAGGLRAKFDHSVSAWVSTNGGYLDGFPHRVHDYQFFMNYTVADVDGDGLPNVISGSGGYFVYAPNHMGIEAEGFPKFTSQWHIATPTVGDFDNDGKIDVAANTREGYLWVWNNEGAVSAPEGSPKPIQWKGFHHDDHNTGNLSVPLRDYPSVLPPDDTEPPGTCGCNSSNDNGISAGWAVVFAGVILLRRRRKKIS
ncbi:MAG: S8 family serine peptidase [Deltaproteobacteria bacterium]|nr:S8 family serine peptidase [Deltaproteobacteria bacterium]